MGGPHRCSSHHKPTPKEREALPAKSLDTPALHHPIFLAFEIERAKTENGMWYTDVVWLKYGYFSKKNYKINYYFYTLNRNRLNQERWTHTLIDF